MIELPQFIVDEYIGATAALDGVNWIGIRILALGQGRIVRGPIENALSAGVPEGWCYETLEGAVIAFASWDGTGEPDGWVRAIRIGYRHRRRPNGDASKEYEDE